MLASSLNSIKIKLVFIYLALVFIVMIVSGTFILISIHNNEITHAQQQTEQFAAFIKQQVIRPGVNFQEALSQGVYIRASLTPMEGNILLPNGTNIASTVEDLANHSDSTIISAMNGRASFTSWATEGRDVNSLEPTRWFLFATPVFDEAGDVQYIVFIRMGADMAFRNLEQVSITIFFSVVLALALTSILGILFASTLTSPLITLTHLSKKLAKGDLHVTIPVKSNDEIGELTESFNQMSRELSSTMERMTDEKNKLEIVLHNMTDGVLAYDNTGALIHANYACMELLNVNVQELSFNDMTSMLGLDIEFSISQTTVKESTMYIDDKYISSNLTAYANKQSQIVGVVIVLQNITKHKILDNMRKEFVANVSHEIRTPLTTIKSYAETLLDGALDNKDLAIDFLSIIDSETDRMALLVKDLLDLSKLDNKDYTLDLKETSLVSMIHRSIRQNKILADNKNQLISFKPHKQDITVWIDDSRINQVINNILTNSIKYSYDDKTIEIFTDETDTCYRVYIKDFGIGIPKEDLSRIFERFYRVDKGRSRAMGGTGLGLSIAKQIMEAHGGKISAKSEINKGTTMILSFNKH